MAKKNIQKKVNFHLKKGALHEELGLAASKPIPVATLQKAKARAKRTHNTTLEKRVNFALNARTFNH